MIAARTAASFKDNLSFPSAAFEQLRREGLLLRPLTEEWGIAPNTQTTLLDAMRVAGGRDLSLGRLYEGHVNALMLVSRYGDKTRAEADVRDGHVFGVWNTDAPDGVKARREGHLLHLSGRKAFGSGAGSVNRPIVTVEIEREGRVMCLVPMEVLKPQIDWLSWNPLGMEGSDSFTVDFTSLVVNDSVILGGAGEYYRQPAFSGGAIRFAAVQFGAAERLAQCFNQWLITLNRTADPFQQTRAGEIEILIESGKQWIAFAASTAELYFNATEEPGIGRMVHAANMTRLAIERICLDVMERVTRGVGARGLLEPAQFEKQIRDLTMYLRQPAPDQALAEVGKRALLPR